MTKAFDPVDNRYNGPEQETKILAFWRDQAIFEKSLEQSAGRPAFTFYEGPPTANGKPGIHHVLARTFKDLFPRYKTMRGYHCTRKAGWDTHGLPVEHEVEKKLGIFDKQEIEKQIGVKKFTDMCRESVMAYIDDWEKMTERMGFWVDLSEAYYTLDNNYIESVWAQLKTIWDKELIYQGYKVVPYDPRIGATLSSHEVAQGYKEVDDPSVYVRFKVKGEKNTSFLAWTTTPWTIPANLLLAVHADIDYAYVRYQDEIIIVAEALMSEIFKDESTEIIKRVKGSDLEGMAYEQVLPYLKPEGDCFKVRLADYVTTESGTGIVHTAPAYGVDDLALGQKHGVPVMHAVGLDGHFIDEVTPVAGMFFKDADKTLVKIMKENGALFRKETYRHNYPFGWRTGDPLMYYAKNAWYIRTSSVKARMVELNQTINWTPDTIRDGRFGNWLDNNVDWALSRERFWGTPLPIWTDGEGDFRMIGSRAELEALSGRSLSDTDLHRPSIDDFSFEVDGKTFTRVPEVIDCWFDSGAMPYAQWHYPFENQDTFEKSFPADFICEAIDQTRGWFYTLHAIATMSQDSVAYKHCICLSHIVDDQGKKMSKSKGNIVNPYDVFDQVGADALRWYFTARLAPDAQKRISVDIVAAVASDVLNTFWNTYAFFIMYARLDAIDVTQDVPLDKRQEIDRWALSLAHQTIETVTESLDQYDAQAAGLAIESFIDQLSNWYVRRNRKRFWKAAAGEDKQAAYLTLYECLDIAHRLIAPFMPFIAETMYANLVKKVDASADQSIHLSAWPKVDVSKIDTMLIEHTDVVQKIVALGRQARSQHQLKVRQPLSEVLVRVPSRVDGNAVSVYQDQILEELNIKTLTVVAVDAKLVEYRIKPNLPRIGKRYGKLIPQIKKALSEADGQAIAAAVASGKEFDVDVAGEALTFSPEDLLVETESAAGYACAEDSGYLVALNSEITEDLAREGLARELIRSVQEARKQAGLDVSDRIKLYIAGDSAVLQAADEHQSMIMSETLTEHWGEGFEASYSVDHQQGENEWTIALTNKI